MKKIILLFICSLMLSSHIISAQITQQQSIEDSVFGWLKVYHLKGVKKKIYEQNKDKQKSIDYLMGYLDEKNNKRMLCLKNNKEKYKNRLLETAETFKYNFCKSMVL